MTDAASLGDIIASMESVLVDLTDIFETLQS